MRGRLYSLLGQLSLRAPQLFNANTRMLQLFFQALATETDSEVQQSVHEGLSLLRQAYQQHASLAVLAANSNSAASAAALAAAKQSAAASSALANELQSLLMSHVHSQERRVRLAALQCMNRLFPFSDVAARFMCVCASRSPVPDLFGTQTGV